MVNFAMLSQLRSLAVVFARFTPGFVKDWAHNNRYLDRFARKSFARLAGEGSIAEISLGPMQGLRLRVGQHVSHAHLSGTYERKTQQAIAGLLTDGAICYDIGASIGYLSLLMARRAKLVYAFEPAPHAIGEIRKQAAVNGFQNIEIVPQALSGDCREVTFALTDVAYGSAINETETRWPTLKLMTSTLDEFVKTHPIPDLIKMDVEGEEASVLRGARTILAAGRTDFCIELHSTAIAHEVVDLLASAGYTVWTLDSQPFQVVDGIVSGAVQVVAKKPQRGRH